MKKKMLSLLLAVVLLGLMPSAALAGGSRVSEDTLAAVLDWYQKAQ